MQRSDAFMLSSGSGSGSDDDDEEFKWEDLSFPPCYEVDEDSPLSIIMVGSCNGLICLHDTKPRDVFLWNPATRQFRLLPKSLSIAGIGDLEREFVAFGYDDVKTKDYKVLQISWFKPYGICGDGDNSNGRSSNWIPVEEYIFRVQVYNLSTDCWRFLEGINSLPGHPQQGLGMNHGVYLNGSYYFLAGYAGCEFILSFDFTKEIFTTLQIQVPPDYHVNWVLTYLGEKLAVLLTAYGFGSYSILVLNEHGGGSMKESSWTKIHSIQLDNFCTLGLPPGRPRGISNDGEFAFIITGPPFKSLQLFNLVTNEVKKGFRTDNPVIKADVYKQSLVSICGNGSIR